MPDFDLRGGTLAAPINDGAAPAWAPVYDDAVPVWPPVCDDADAAAAPDAAA